MSTVDRVAERIVTYIGERGRARWSDLLKDLNLSKATLYRALEKLINRGVIVKVGEWYVLTDKSYATLFVDEVCSIIDCMDREKIVNEIVALGSKVIEDFNIIHRKFVETYRIPVLGVFEEVFKKFLSVKGVFLTVMYEFSKILKGFEIIMGCSELKQGDEISNALIQEIENMYRDFLAMAKMDMGLRREDFDVIEKIGAIFDKYGYKDVVRVGILNIPGLYSEFNMSDLVLSAFRLAGKLVNEELYGKFVAIAMEIAKNYYKTGCRPLGVKEREKLIQLLS